MTARRITLVAAVLAAVAAVVGRKHVDHELPTYRLWRSYPQSRAYRVHAPQDLLESYGQPILPCGHPLAGRSCYESVQPSRKFVRPDAETKSAKLLRGLVAKVENLQHGLDAILVKVMQLSASGENRKSANVARGVAADLKAITQSRAVLIPQDGQDHDEVAARVDAATPPRDDADADEECDEEEDDEEEDCSDDRPAAANVNRKVFDFDRDEDDGEGAKNAKAEKEASVGAAGRKVGRVPRRRPAKPKTPPSTTESLTEVVKEMESDELSTTKYPEEFGIDAAKLPTVKP